MGHSTIPPIVLHIPLRYPPSQLPSGLSCIKPLLSIMLDDMHRQGTKLGKTIGSEMGDYRSQVGDIYLEWD